MSLISAGSISLDSTFKDDKIGIIIQILLEFSNREELKACDHSIVLGGRPQSNGCYRGPTE